MISTSKLAARSHQRERREATANPILTVCDFPTVRGPKGKPAIGHMRHVRWADFTYQLQRRRDGEKDGVCFLPCSSRHLDGGNTVQRREEDIYLRTAVVLDIETNKKTGEIPDPPDFTARMCQARGLAAVVYTSHNHHPEQDIRYRVVLPLSGPIEPDLSASEIVAGWLGLSGVLDTSKIGPANLFYYPSCPPGQHHLHAIIVVDGEPLDSVAVAEAADALQAERDRVAAEAHEAAQRAREARLAARGDHPENSLIERIRAHYDLGDMLRSHGYDQSGDFFRHPNSSSGSYGANIKNLGGIDRVFSHNATDPLHKDNLPAWCTVAAVDVFDVVAILDFQGDRQKALRDLSQRLGLTKTEERRAVAKVMFRLIQQNAPQAAIEAAAFAEGERVGLTRAEIIEVAHWVVSQKAAA